MSNECWVVDYGDIREALLMSVCPITGWHTVHFLDDFLKTGPIDPTQGFQGCRFSPFDVWPHVEYPPQQWASNLDAAHTPRKWGHGGHQC